MQIVINIPKQDYYNVLQYTTLKSNTDFENLMICAVQNGTPLPKGHGRLVDADKLVEKDSTCDMWTDSGYEPMVTIETIENMPTIIEADKENE